MKGFKRCMAIVLSITMVIMNLSYVWALPDTEIESIEETTSMISETTPSNAEENTDDEGVLLDGEIVDDTTPSDALEDGLIDASMSDALLGIMPMVDAPTPLVPGAATVTGLRIASTIDGTDFTATDGPGLDSSPSNAICRTFDTVTYTLSYSTALKAEAGDVAGYTEGDVYFKAVIPNATLAEVAFDTGSMAWAKDVSQVQQGSDIVITGKRHITSGSLPSCIPGMGTLTMPVLVKASYQGKTYTPQFSVWLDGDEAEGTKDVTAETFTVSSTPTMNVAVGLGKSSKAWGTQTSSYGTPLGEGLIQDFTADIEVGSTTTSKGSEAPAGPITFDLVLSGNRIDGVDTTTPTTVPLDTPPSLAYIEDTAGQATISFEEKQGTPGTYTVTVSNYAIPELSINTQTPIPIISLKVGVFQGEPQGQPKTIPNDKNFEIIVQDNNFAATGVSGNAIPVATAPTYLDNQTDNTDDRSIASYNNLTGLYFLGCVLTPEVYASTDLSIHELTNSVTGPVTRYSFISATGNREYAPGSYMTAMTSSYSQANKNPWANASTALTGVDCLFKFDDKTMQIPDNEQWEVSLLSATDDQLAQVKSTIRYVAKQDKAGWTNYTECAESTMRELVSYASLEELENDGAVCVGVVIELRDFSYYTDRANRGGVMAYYRLQAKQNPQLIEDKETGWMCYSNRLYTAKNYTPTMDDHMDVSSHEQAFMEWGVYVPGSTTGYPPSWPADGFIHNTWGPSYYNADGTRNGGLNNGLVGDSFFITGRDIKMNYAIESQDEYGAVKTVYDVSNGDEKVDLVVTPDIVASDDSPMSAMYSIRIYDNSPFVPGSAVLGGTYNPATGQVEGGTPVELIPGDHNAAGYTSYNYTNLSMRPSEMLPLHYSVKIPSDTTVNGQSFLGRAWLYSGEEGITPTAFKVGGLSYSAVKVGDIRFTKTVETDNATAPTDTQASAKNGLTYDIGMENTSAIAITDMKALDILPYDGDLLDSDFTGTYKVKPITLNTGIESIAGNGLKVYYTTDASVQSASFNAGTVDVTDGKWTEATNTGTDTVGTYVVDEHATAITITGTLPVSTTYHLLLPFDTTEMLGTLGNGASISSPNIPNEEKLISVNSTSTEVIHAIDVTNTLTNIITNNTVVTTPMGEDYTEKLTAKMGYRLPDTITVKVGGTDLTPAVDPSNPVAGEYIYDPTTGNVTVPGVSTTDDIEVIAEAVKQVKLTNTLTNITTDKPVRETVDVNTPYTETLTVVPGYELPDTITVIVGGTPVTINSGTPSGGITYDKTTGKVTFDDTVITDNTEIIAEAVPIKYTVKFETDAGGMLTGGADQNVDYKDTATAGATATPDATYIFLGWAYDYTGIDGVHYSGTTTDYTTIPIMNDVTFTAKYAENNSLSASADHGYVSTTVGTTPETVGTDTTSTTELGTGTGDKPGSVGFKSQENYTPDTVKVTTDDSHDTIVITDKDGNVVTAIDPTKSGKYTITVTHADTSVDTTDVVVTPESGTTPGSIVSTNITTGMKFDIGFKPQEHELINTLTYLTSSKNGTQKVEYGTDYTETLMPHYVSGSKYLLPETIKVKVGGTELTQANDPANPQPGEFGYDSTTGKVIVPGGDITGDVEIIGIADVPITNTLTNITTDNTDTKIQIGTEYSETLTPSSGYRLPDEITVKVGGVTLTPAADPANPQPGEYVYDQTTGKVTVPGSETMGSVEIIAEAVKVVELTNDISHGTNSKGDGKIDEGEDYTTTLIPDTGYVLPETITITIGGVDYTVTSGITSTDGITYDKTTGKLDIPGDIITDDMKITTICEKKQFTVTTDITNGSSTNVSGGIDMYDPYDTVIIPEDGYKLSGSVTVTIGGTKYTIISGRPVDGITYSSTTGELHIPGEIVVGDVIIKTDCYRTNSHSGGTSSSTGGHAANITKVPPVAVTSDQEVDPLFGLNPDGTGLGNKLLAGIPKTGQEAVKIIVALMAMMAFLAAGMALIRRQENK